MFKCTVCGTELPDDARYCTNCLVYVGPLEADDDEEVTE